MSNANITTEDLLIGTSDLSYKGRLQFKDTVNNLSRKIAYQHSYTPASARNLSKFLALREGDSYESVTTAVSTATTIAASWQSRLMDEESLALMESIQAEAVNEAINNFYNSYIASSNSDVVYRLGQVTRVKHLFTNVRDIYGNVKKTAKDTTSTLGQTDEFGRLDTVSNMRTKIDIDPCKTNNELITSGYSEYYINWFFPPFTTENFLTTTSELNETLSNLVDASEGNLDYTKLQSTKTASQKAVDAALQNSNATKSLNTDGSGPTYDYLDMMCIRDGFTYRTAAFKAVNDNINFLQYIFEQVSGVVSTYLTEWDISLYIQEGLLSDYQTTKNVWLCNRIQMDNPQGLTGDGAYTWGALNACISKLSVDGNGPTNTKTWIPSYYYASAYWMPYSYGDRGDGLDVFWDYAIDSTGKHAERNNKLVETTIGRIQHDDEIHAAYAGWHNFNDIQYYQILYTTPDDGLSTVDTVHLQETSDGFSSLQEELESILDAVYSDDSSLGFPDSSLVETVGFDGGPTREYVSSKNSNDRKLFDKKIIQYQMDDVYDSASKKVISVNFYRNEVWVASTDGDGNDTSGDSSANVGTNAGSTDTVSIDGEGNISIMGCPIPGSSLLKLFLKKDSYKSKALSLANKMSSGGGGGSSGNFYNFGKGASKRDSTDPNSAQELGQFGELNNNSPYEAEHYSNSMGIPRLGPALYGGPHGAYTSPQCVQSYFQADNPFLRPIARIEPSLTDWTREDKEYYYQGIEAQYMYNQGITKPGAQLGAQVGRSPSESMHILRSGYCETVTSYMKVSKRIYAYIPASISYEFNWGGYWHRGHWHNDYWHWRGWYNSWFGWHRYNRKVIFPTTKGRNENNTGPSEITYYNSWSRNKEWVDYFSVKWGNAYWANDWHVGKKVSYCGRVGIVRRSYTAGSDRHYEGGFWGMIQRLQDGSVWWNNRYTISVYETVPTRYGSYTDFVWEAYQRPLMHNMPEQKWQIAKYRRINADPHRIGYDDGFYKKLKDLWGISSNYKYATAFFNLNVGQSSNMYRLTTPDGEQSRVSVVWYDKVTDSEHCPPHHYTFTERHRGETQIINKILVNASNPEAWHYPFYCIMNDYDSGEVQNRKKNGPRFLAQIPTRLKLIHITYTGIDHDNDRHKCHKDCHYWNITKSSNYSFIEVDLEHTKQFWASSNYGVKPFEANSKSPDLMSDWPTQDSWLPNNNTSVFDCMKDYSSMTSFHFAGEDYGEERHHGIRGIGIYAALPGLIKEIPDQKSFEDGNDYLNMSRMLGDNVALNTKIKDLPLTTTEITGYGTPGQTYENDPSGRFYIPGGKRLYTRYVMGANTGVKFKSGYSPSGYNKDPGMALFLKKMYLTATMFIPDRNSDINQNLHPFITNVSSCLRSALKMVKHQRAYLVYAKELFENVIDPNEVINLLDKSVDKRVTSVSCSRWPLKSKITNPYYNSSSIYYNYWIERAYDYYSGLDTNTKNENSQTPMQALSAAFQKRINQIDDFTKDALDFINNKNSGQSKLSSDEWSYNDFLTVYKIFGDFRTTLDNPDNTIEEYFYSYLNVLYEYRKYYINKRCNKQDGTLWACRQFESIIPSLTTARVTTPDADSPLISTSDPNINQYNIIMKSVQNTFEDKAKAIANNTTLDTDRICRLYMSIEYTTENEYNNFINALAAGTNVADIDEIVKAKKWDKVNGTYQYVYIKKPKDGTYRLISKEYLKNKQNVDYNDKLEDLYQKGTIDLQTKKARLKEVNEKILDCIFPIIWNKDTDNEILQTYLNAAQELRVCEKALESAKTNYQNIQVTYKDLIASNKTSEENVDTDYLEKQNMYNLYIKTLEDANDFAPMFLNITGYSIKSCENITSVSYANGYYILKNYCSGKISFNSLPSNMQKLFKSSDSEAVSDGKIYLTKVDDYYKAGNALAASKAAMNNALIKKYRTYAYNIRREVYYNGLKSNDSIINSDTMDTTIKSLLSIRLTNNLMSAYGYKNVSDLYKSPVLSYNSSNSSYSARNIMGQISRLRDIYNTAVTSYNDANVAYEIANKAYMNSLSKQSKKQFDAKYTWRDPGKYDPVYPTIAWNVPTGVDISAINGTDDSDMSAINKLCGLKKYKDYWVITIPEASWPYDIGYDTSLRIKTYESESKDANTYSANRLTTIAGPFAYALYPITEDQSGAIAAIGADMNGVEERIKETFK